MKKGLCLLLVLLTVVTGLFAGCSSGNADQPASTGTDQSVSSAGSTGDQGSGEVVNLHIMHWNDMPQKVIQKFEEDNPSIKVQFEKFTVDKFMQVIKTRIAAQELPDILGAQENDFPIFMKQGIYLDITNESFLNNFYDSAKEELIAFGNGKAYAVPTNAWSMGIFVNVDMFKQNDVKVPENYDEIMAAALKFKEKGIYPFVQGLKDSWCVNQMSISQFKLQLEDATFYDRVKTGGAKWTDASMIEAYTQWADMFAAKGMMYEGSMGLTYEQAYQLFEQGKVPMWPMGTWASSLFKDKDGNAKKFNFDMDYIPQYANKPGEEAVNAGTNIGAMYAISASTKNVNEAKKFFEWLTEPANAELLVKESGSLFPIKGIDYATAIPYGDKLVKATFEMKIKAPFDIGVDPAVKAQLTVANQNILAGISDVKKEMEEVQRVQETANQERK
jgi:raffinose/stachyose/melibiose transport system substrate-binding protein